MRMGMLQTLSRLQSGAPRALIGSPYSCPFCARKCRAALAVQAGTYSTGGPQRVQQLTVAELKGILDQEDLHDVQLLDVREDEELRLASLPHFAPLPLSRFQEWGPSIAEDLNPDAPTVVLCHAGMRSMRVALFLTEQGFRDVYNVQGGIDEYSRKIDPSVPQY